MELYAYHIKDFIRHSLILLEEYKDGINNINVFPVADKDTGTNIYNTLKGIWERVKDIEVNSVGHFLKHVAEAALESAQGNSGNILAMFFYGLYEGLKDKEKITIEDLSNALKLGYEYAKSSVQNPKKGTILSVMEALVESFEKEKKDIAKALKEGINNALFYLEVYREEVDALKKNNVVDAGGLGFIIMLKGWLKAHGFDIEIPIDKYLKKVVNRKSVGAFCINILLKDVQNFDELKDKLNNVGESLVIKKIGNKAKIHIHHNNLEYIKKLVAMYGKIVKITYTKI